MARTVYPVTTVNDLGMVELQERKIFMPVHLSTSDVQVENFLQGRLHHEDGNSCRRSRVGHFHNTRATPKVGTSYRFKMATNSPEFFRVTCKGCTQETMLSPVPRVAFLYLLYGG